MPTAAPEVLSASAWLAMTVNAAVRLRNARRGVVATGGRALPVGQLGPSLVPDCLRRGACGLADVPGGPHGTAPAAGRTSVRAAGVPEADLASWVFRRVSAAGWRYRARVRVHADAAAVVGRINPAVETVTAVDDETCVLETGADTVDSLAVHLGLLRCDFEVTDPPELVATYASWPVATSGRRLHPQPDPRLARRLDRRA